MILEKFPNIPRHLLTTEDAEILKNVVLHSVATAFASIVWNIDIKSYIAIKISLEESKLKKQQEMANHFFIIINLELFSCNNWEKLLSMPLGRIQHFNSKDNFWQAHFHGQVIVYNKMSS